MNTITAPAAALWHTNASLRHTTRHPEPAAWFNTQTVENLTEAQKLRDTAVHEAAHTILFLAAGIPVRYVEILTKTESDASGADLGTTFVEAHQARLDAFLVALAAGERAEDRWMRESNLWTPARAWVIERLAINDRLHTAGLVRQFLKTELTYGEKPTEWSDLAWHHQVADEALHKNWARITDFADALIEHRYLTARQVADFSGLANPAA